ncbi:MAG: putative Ig domain-containing protein [Phycisphaerales bacterium]|nr:MAG: putative Ig domain-containing protein [Phycisphaerales bacterium]
MSHKKVMISCTLVLPLFSSTSVLKGAFAPWASDTDPTDVPKSHIQNITSAPFTYSITQGGTMDGKMCTTLPGVWEPYEQTWESNRSIRMENVGTSNVINPWLKIGPIDFFSQQTIADSVVEGLSTEREKAMAIFYFYITHRYHKGNGDNTAQGDVSQAINVFGFNTCGNSTLCISDLLDKVAMPDCIFSHCPGHVVPQVFFDGKYNTLDGDMATFMLMRDNHTLASELDLVRDHDLIKRVHQYGIMSPMNPLKNNEDYAQYYTWEGDTTVQLDGWAWWNMGMVLRPHEAIEWRWGHNIPVKYHGDMAGYPPTAPDTIYNGLWEYAPDFNDDSQWRAGATVTNIANNNGVLMATDGGAGSILWHMKSPYQFIGGNLLASGDGYAFEVGFTDAKDWRKKVFTPLVTLAEFDGKFEGRTADAREYWLRCTLRGRAFLNAVNIKNDIQMAPLAMPSMTVGDNSFTYLEHTDNKTGTNAARNLRVTHTWVERSKTRPPKAPASPVYPVNGGESDGTDVVFRWDAATDPDGDAVEDYHFQLSDRSDMRWPMSPNFDKYISRTTDKGNARYALPRPGFLTHGQTYYWRVKAKDSNGVWGPWSDTWSFTAQGPEYPVDVAMDYDVDTGTGTLTWSANPAGRRPVKYRVYGSDEQGFTVHDAPYDIKLGETTELDNPFPANFVAEVTDTSLNVIGVGNELPNANRAYYRVVAVDGSGNRSGDSDYVEAPRPFIYSTPVTAAPMGRPYRYQVKAIRSIGDLRRRDNTKPKPGTRFWKIERLRFSLAQKPDWMSINPDTGLITGTSDATGGTVTVSVTLTKEHRLVHDKNNIVWGNEYEQSKTYETIGPVTQQFIVHGADDTTGK